MKVYEELFEKCDQPEWHIIPSDKNWYKLYQVSKVLLKVFEDMNLKWPQLSPDQETAYLKAKAELAQRTSDEERERYRIRLERKQAKKLAKKQAKLEKKQSKKLEKEKKKQAKEALKIQKKQEKNLKKTKQEDIIPVATKTVSKPKTVVSSKSSPIK